jgi:DNA-directed RNA polymerase subunit RPC12/RpoP
MKPQNKCASCGKKFIDVILPQLKEVNPEFASRIWCNDCVAKKWKEFKNG